MLGIQDAMRHIKEQFPESFGNDIRDVRLEEIEEKENNYLLTISYVVKDESLDIPASLKDIGLGNTYQYQRLYKDVIFDRATGRISSIKIHKNA